MSDFVEPEQVRLPGCARLVRLVRVTITVRGLHRDNTKQLIWDAQEATTPGTELATAGQKGPRRLRVDASDRPPRSFGETMTPRKNIRRCKNNASRYASTGLAAGAFMIESYPEQLCLRHPEQCPGLTALLFL